MKRMRVALVIVLLAVAAFGAKAQVVLRGDASYWIHGSDVTVEVEDITNFGDKTTERLRFVVWASKDHWENYDRGRILGLEALPRLGAHANFDGVRRTMHRYDVPNGWYYVTLTLAERIVDENGKVRWEIRDGVEFDERRYLGRSSVPVSPFRQPNAGALANHGKISFPLPHRASSSAQP